MYWAGRSSIAIIGGGFTGASLAAALLRISGPNVSVILIERERCAGHGVAYGTRCGRHLLNVRAQNMSAFDDDPGHFLHWARLYYDSGVQSGDFLPRRVYGQYIESLLAQAVQQHPGRFERIHDEAVSIACAEGQANISLRSGQKIAAEKVVLALGNFPPSDPKLPGKQKFSPRYVANGWSEDAIADLGQDQSVLLIGTGLTAIDVVLSLRHGGFSGTIHMLSRHGLLPRPQNSRTQWPAFWDGASAQTARGLVRLVRTQVRKAQEQNIDWRAVLDSIRPVTQKMWGSLTLTERWRFLRHVRPYWDVHRHRVAPEIGSLLQTELESGSLQVHAGRITDYAEHRDFISLTYRERRSQQLQNVKVARVINCTGPDADSRRVRSTLLQNLMRQNVVRPDALFLGVDTAENGALLNNGGVASDVLYTVGPLRRGNLWESIAVPEIREQVADLAAHLVAGFRLRTRVTHANQLTTVW
ncbi:MAG TPA: FAD/NAD(P)-binding protein [Terriglobales bacterium]|nr:FAD/NAD(P)-binding protein [Terriglobales bacterium]